MSSFDLDQMFTITLDTIVNVNRMAQIHKLIFCTMEYKNTGVFDLLYSVWDIEIIEIQFDLFKYFLFDSVVEGSK